MRLLLAASELTGFAREGGLGDVAARLPAALAEMGHECAVIAPLYAAVRRSGANLDRLDAPLAVPIRGKPVEGALWKSTLPGTEVPVYLVEQAGYFERDDPEQGRGLYQLREADGTLQDYPDSCERFVYFSRAVLEAIRLVQYWPDVLHVHDWQTGLIPVYLHEEYGRLEDAETAARYQKIRTLFTVHNIAYQGLFWHWDMMLAGLGWHLFNFHQLEYHGQMSLLKGGLVFADYISTVSPTYAEEVRRGEHDGGLGGIFQARHERLFGIVNGVDYQTWDPGVDPHLAASYTAESWQPGKAACKAALQARLGLAAEPETPLLGVVSSLSEEAGVRLLGEAAPAILEDHVQLAVLGEGGEGEEEAGRGLVGLVERFPRQVSLTFGVDDALAHQIHAGADMLLMPSLSEPCGLAQLHSMKYGTLPIVRATGGLADTVVDTTPASIVAGTATGFRFEAAEGPAFLEAVRRAVGMYRGRPASWLRVVRHAMSQDWSWGRTAAEYDRLFHLMLEEPEGG